MTTATTAGYSKNRRPVTVILYIYYIFITYYYRTTGDINNNSYIGKKDNLQKKSYIEIVRALSCNRVVNDQDPCNHTDKLTTAQINSAVVVVGQ